MEDIQREFPQERERARQGNQRPLSLPLGFTPQTKGQSIALLPTSYQPRNRDVARPLYPGLSARSRKDSRQTPSSPSHLVSRITEHLGSYQPSCTSTNHNDPLRLGGPIEAQGHNPEQHLIVRIMHTFFKGILAVGSLPIQGGLQAEEEGDQDEEVPGWR